MRNYKILVDKINKLSFLDDNLLSIMNNRNINNTNKTKVHDNSVKIINKKLSNFFFPEDDYTDSLYWCYIIHKYDIDEYIMNKSNIYQYEKQGKLDLISKYIYPNKKEIKKEFKMKYSDIESNCVYDKTMNISVFIILMNYMNVNVIYYDDKLYYELIKEDNNDLIIINKNKNGKYGICLNNDKSDIGNIKHTRFVVDNINKPLKAISNYKVNELKEIFFKLKLNIKKDEKKYITKKEMYQLLREILN